MRIDVKHSLGATTIITVDRRLQARFRIKRIDSNVYERYSSFIVTQQKC